MGVERPTRGAELHSEALQRMLRGKRAAKGSRMKEELAREEHELTSEELDELSVPDLKDDSFIWVDGEYFEQACEYSKIVILSEKNGPKSPPACKCSPRRPPVACR